MPQPGEITADPSFAQAKKTNAVFKSLLQSGHGHHTSSVREDHYKGHHIVIRTTYEIEVDGRPFHGNLNVTNAGTVQYHGIPNVSSNSAVELIRSVIDAFPEDFAADHEEEHGHGGHAHGGRASARGSAKTRGGKSKAGSRSKSRNKSKSRSKSKSREKRHAGSRKHSR